MSLPFDSANPHTERARLLIELDRYADAEAEVYKALAIEPNSSMLHARLAVCLLRRDAVDDALAAARTAVACDPDNSYAHYIFSFVTHRSIDEAGALEAIGEALRLAPDDADYHYFKAAIHYDYGKYYHALSASDAGLALRPQHIGCANLRARCLAEFEDRTEALETIERALALNPEYYWSHETRASLALKWGGFDNAVRHYREALRLNPQSESARRGLVESLKKRYFVYRTLFKLFDWSDGLKIVARTIVALAAVALLNDALRPIGNRFLRLVAAIGLVTAAYSAIGCFTVFCGDPLANFMLSFEALGRRAVSAEARRRSIVTAVALTLTVGLLAAAFFFRMPLVALPAVSAMLAPGPLNFMLRQPSGLPRLWAALDYVGFMLAMVVLFAVLCWIPLAGLRWWRGLVSEYHAALERRAEVRRSMSGA